MDRREFIKRGSLAPTALLLPQLGCDSESEPDKNITPRNPDESIVIVGAGVAGLSASRTLRTLGITDVTILEARERVGGRVWTSQDWAGTPLDLGASWIHGISGNPIDALARNAGVRTITTDYENLIIFGRDGQLLSSAQEARLEQLAQEVVRAIGQSPPGDSLQGVVEALLAGRSEDEQAMINFLLSSFVELGFAADIGQLSALSVNYGEEFGGDDVLFPGGYMDVFADAIAGADVQMGTRVDRVTLGSGGVSVSTNRGVFQADRVVVTLPLGVLQRGGVVFDPPLPAAKLAAITKLGMGVLNKTYLRFEEAFWPAAPDGIGFIAPDKGEWVEWLNMRHYLDKPILVGFNAGSFGREIETWSDQAIVSSAMETLRTMYGSAVPEPNAFQITRWASDPLAYGSYSFLPPGADEDTIEELGRPVEDRIFFAGEATSVDYPSTVHGAFLTGDREARRIARL